MILFHSRYVWKINGEDFEEDLSHHQVTLLPNGTLHFEQATVLDQGYYQCYVTNSLGTAVSSTTMLRKASKTKNNAH